MTGASALNFIRRLFSRKRQPPEQRTFIGVNLYARTAGTEPWVLLGMHPSAAVAEEAAQQHAASECFRTGHVVFFEFKSSFVYVEPT